MLVRLADAPVLSLNVVAAEALLAAVLLLFGPLPDVELLEPNVFS